MLTLSLVLIVTSISPSLQYTDSEFYLNFSYNSMTNKAIAPVLHSCNSGAITAYNIFMEEKILNPTLGNLIADTLIAGPMDRFDIMNEFKEKASSLPEKKKLLANDIYEAFIEACCVGSPSKRLLIYVNSHNEGILRALNYDYCINH